MIATRDTMPTVSINKLKEMRRNLFKMTRTQYRKDALIAMDALLRLKRALYFGKYQHMRGFGRWRNKNRVIQQVFSWRTNR